MKQILTTAAVLAAVLLALPVGAEECFPSTSDAEIFVDPFYVDNDPCQPGCLFSVWLYQESNGIDGLQRWDEVKDDTCGGMIDPDSLAS